jgi:hypothetical protein
MKTKQFLSIYLLIAVFLLCNATGNAQNGNGNGNGNDYITITGVVKDRVSKKNLEYVNVSAVGTNIGTVTNEDGEFSLKISKSIKVSDIQLSRIGFYNALISIKTNDDGKNTFFLAPESFVLNEVQVFSWQNPRDLVKAAIEKVSVNYPMQPNMLTGFYRETVQKRRRYINISEAVIEIYKDAYNRPANRDQVKVLKGRKLLSPKVADTLTVKFLGGPNIPVYLDIIKNPDVLLDPEALQLYSFRMGEATSIDDRLHYTVHFEPQSIVDYPLYAGTMYIERASLSLTRAEFRMDMSNKQKVTSAILKEKPMGLRFTPEEVSYIVTYKQQGDKTFLNYMRNEIKFKCDWKRRLFATNYEVIGETVITDRNEQNVARIPGRETFSLRQSLSHEVGLYQDEDFWSNYNIIEPTESLESAVNRLKKQNLRSQ